MAVAPVSGQPGRDATLAATRTLSLPHQRDEPDPVLSLELGIRGSESAFTLPGTLRFTPRADASLLRDTEITMGGVFSSQNANGVWKLDPLHGVTVAARRAVASGDSFATSIGSHAVLGSAGIASHGADLFAWFGNAKHDVSIAAGLACTPERIYWSTLSADYSHTISRNVSGFGNVAYAAGRGPSWLTASEGVTYQIRPGMIISVALRHDRQGAWADSSASVGLTVSLHN